MTNTNITKHVNTSQLDWWIEKQPHVEQIQIFVRRPVDQFQFSVQKRSIQLKLAPSTDVDQSSEQTVETSDNNESSIIEPINQSVEETIALDCEVDPSPSSFTLYQGKQWCRLTVRIIAECGLDSDDSEEFPPSAELQSRNLQHLQCRCGRSLLSNPPQRCLPLPSAYWHELVDLWYCHTENNDKLDRLSGLTVMTKSSLALLGTHDLRFLRSDVDPAAITVDSRPLKIEREKTKRPSSTSISEPRCVRCASCRTMIGLAVIVTAALPIALQCRDEKHSSEQSNNQTTDQTINQSNIVQQDEIHLFKHYVSNVDPLSVNAFHMAAESGLIESLAALDVKQSSMSTKSEMNSSVPSLFMPYYSLETYFSSLLLARCDARCSYRFRVEINDETDDDQMREISDKRWISITLLNIDTCIRSMTSPSSITRRKQGLMCPVLKCAYQLIESNQSINHSKNLDVIHCTAQEFQSLLDILQSHHSDIPNEFSYFGKMKLTYLKKLSRNQ